MAEKERCEFPDCPTNELTKSLKEIAERLSDFKVFENDIKHIRSTMESIDHRITKDVDNLFNRMRIVEQDKVSRTELFSAIGATGVIVGVLSFIIQTVTK